MAESEITVQNIDDDGVTPSYEAANVDGNYFLNGGKCLIHVKNGGVGSITMDVKAQNACSQGELHDRSITVGAGAEAMLAVENLQQFNDGDSNTHLEYDDVTSVTIGVFQIP